MERQRGYCLARSILGENSTKFRRHSSSKLENHISLLEANKKKKKENQKSLKMKPNAKPLSLISHICLALVILMFDAALNVNFVQQVTGNNSPFSFQSSASSINNQSVLFKDHSGPSSGKIQSLDVICGKNFMSVRAEFSAPFYGIVFSKGTFGQENCVYIKPGSGLIHAAFNVYYDQCGTKPDLEGKFYENTIVIQYGSDIIEAYDEAKRLRCEWFEAYEKPASFRPAIPVADLEVVEMNFQGDDIDCWMEIQEGIEPWGRPLNKMVPVGQPMTLVVAINDNDGQFDMRVKSCFAHDGVQKPIALTDEYGCVLRPKMLTTFTKIKNPGFNRNATVLSYARFLTFKFPDSMSVQIQCTVEVCRNGCADACQLVASKAVTNIQSEVSIGGAKPWFSGSAPQPSRLGADGDEPAGGPLKRIVGASDLAPNESQQVHSRPMRIPFNPQQQQQQQQQLPPTREVFTGMGNENYASSNNVNQLTVARKPYQHRMRQQAQPQPMLPPQILAQQPQQVRLAPARPQSIAEQPEVSMARDDMIDGSDSNRRPAIAEAAAVGIQRVAPRQELVQQQPSNRHVSVAAGPPPPQAQAPVQAPAQVQQASTSAAVAASTARPEAESAAEASASDSSSPVEEAPELASDLNLTRLSAPAGEAQQQQAAAAAAAAANNQATNQNEPERNEQPADVANVDHSQQQQQQQPGAGAGAAAQEEPTESVKREEAGRPAQSGGNGDQQAGPTEQPAVAASDIRPSVQGYDEGMDSGVSKPEGGGNEQVLQVKSQQVGGAQNSLKTVELEVPANEDPISGMLAASAGSRLSQSPFSSVRLSNVDSGSSSSGNNNNDEAGGFLNYENKDARLGAIQSSGNSYNSPGSVIQPREPASNIEMRDKGSSGSSSSADAGSSAPAINNSPVAATSAGGKSRFGTRSQPIVVNVQGSVEAPARRYSNHQQASLPANDNADSVAPPAEANSERVLTDRSDDLVGPTVDLASIAASNAGEGAERAPSNVESVSNNNSNNNNNDGEQADEVAASVVQSSPPVPAVSNSNDESPNKPEFDSMRHRTSAIMPEESSAVSSSSDSAAADQQGGSKQQLVQPVVGTDELASGPVQFESRIGAAAASSSSSSSSSSPSVSESLEEAITKLQQQQLAPQTAALVSNLPQPDGPTGGVGSDSSQANANDADKLERRSDVGGQQQGALAGDKAQQETSGSNDRLDISSLLALAKRQKPAEVVAPAAEQSNKQQQQQPLVDGLAMAASSQQSQIQSQQPQQQQQSNQFSQQKQAQKQELNQPYPNVVGQAKVIPDPGVHGSTMMATHSTTNLASILPVEQQQAISKQMAANQQQQQQQQQQLQLQQQQQAGASTLSPVSQVPSFGVAGFSKNHIQPAIQKLSQQFLHSQHQQHKQTTSKPTRGRFSLLSPQKALQAVASRFLSKTDTQQQQAQIPAAMRQIPTINANNVKLSSDQEQKLLLLLQQQAQQAQQAGLFPQKLANQQQQQSYLQSTPVIVPQPQQQQQQAQQLYQSPQNWQQQQQQQQQQGPTSQATSNLPVNYLQQQPKQMIRSRRSLVPSTDVVAQAIDEDLIEIGKNPTKNDENKIDQVQDTAYLGPADLPQIKIRRLLRSDAIYGICLPVFSLTFMITCVFWLIVFTTIYGIYYCINSKRQQRK